MIRKTPREVCDGIVADGHERLVEAVLPRVEAEVRVRQRRGVADWRERRRIEAAIRAEIARRLDELAPPGALY